MYFYDLLTKKIKELNSKNKKIYICNNMYYENAHLGCARTYAVSDMIKRYLSFKGYEILHIGNTPADTELINKTKKEGAVCIWINGSDCKATFDESIEKIADYWIGIGAVLVNGAEMNKDSNKFIMLTDVLREYEPNTVSMFFALEYYRSPIEYSAKQMKHAESTAKQFFDFIEKLSKRIREKEKKNIENNGLKNEIKNKIKNFYYFLDKDFNLPTALTYILSIISSIDRHLESGACDYSLLEYAKKELENIFYIIGLEYST